MRYLATLINQNMKKLFIAAIIPLTLSCVSNQKYSQLEATTQNQAEIERYLNELVELKQRDRAGDSQTEQRVNQDIKELKSRLAATTSIEEYVSQGVITQEVAERIIQEFRNETEIQNSMQTKEMMFPCPNAERANAEVDAIAYILDQKLNTIEGLEVLQNTYRVEVVVSKDKIATNSGSLTSDGEDVLAALIASTSFKQGLKMQAHLTYSNGISGADTKLGEAILDYVAADKSVRKPISSVSYSKGNFGKVVFEVILN